MRLGLIAGRHPLPVEQYLLQEADAAPEATPVLYDALEAAIERLPWWPDYEPVDLFVTGLTRAALIGVWLLHDRGHDLTIWEWDQATQRYHATLQWAEIGGLVPLASGLYLDAAGQPCIDLAATPG